MAKYIATMKKDGKEFPYSIVASNVFEADERLVKLAETLGWAYINLELVD